MTSIKIVTAQINLTVGAIEQNTQQIIETTRQAMRQHQADLVVFPELSITSYPPEDLLFRHELYTRVEAALDEIAKQTAPAALLVGYPSMDDNKRYNSVAYIANGKVVTTYHKQYLPNYTVFDEKRYFDPGDSPCIITINNISIGVVICEDLWHPAPAQQAKQSGAELIISLNASPFDSNKVLARETMLSERAQDNDIAIIYLNLVGGQDELVFDGGSMVVDATGERIIQAPYYQEQLTPITVAKKNHHITIKNNTLPSRLTAEQNIYQALVLAVRDYINKNAFPGAIIGLSGGIDSALTLAIAVDAIGADNVIAVMMPSPHTAEISIEDAKLEAEILNVTYHTINIAPLYDQFQETLAPLFINQPKNTTEENIQARIRGTLLMALSNKFGKIVLTTGNKSELSVGYATLYGDMAGAFSVLKDIPKTLVYKLANYRNSISKVIPERVITRAPSAELSDNQTDQDSLPPYDILDDIIKRYIELEQSNAQICDAGHNPAIVEKIIRLINNNEFKRRQAAVGLRISQKAFGKDRRYPITSGFNKKV